MMGISRWVAMRCGAPAEGWRITMQSAPTARKVYPVSMTDSPFSMLEPDDCTSVVIAPRDLAANSNDERVRVDAS
jgi:hypothetical protein